MFQRGGHPMQDRRSRATSIRHVSLLLPHVVPVLSTSFVALSACVSMVLQEILSCLPLTLRAILRTTKRLIFGKILSTFTMYRHLRRWMVLVISFLSLSKNLHLLFVGSGLQGVTGSDYEGTGHVISKVKVDQHYFGSTFQVKENAFKVPIVDFPNNLCLPPET